MISMVSGYEGMGEHLRQSLVYIFSLYIGILFILILQYTLDTRARTVQWGRRRLFLLSSDRVELQKQNHCIHLMSRGTVSNQTLKSLETL